MTPADAIAKPTTGLSSFDAEVEAHQRQSMFIAFVVGAPLLLLFGIGDFIFALQYWRMILAWRLVGALTLAALARFTYRSHFSVNIAGVVGVAAVMGPLEFGVLATGGAGSPYLFSVLVPAATIAILIPLRPVQLSVLLVETFIIAFGPLPFINGQAGMLPALIPLSFLLSLSIVAVLGSVLNGRLRLREYTGRQEAGRQERLATLGQLAGSLAHEMSSPLTVLTGELELARLRAPPELVPGLAAASAAAERMTEVLKAMRRGARNATGDARPVDLAKEIDLSLALVRHQLKDHVEIVREFSPVPPVLGHATLLGQVFVNLIINAGDALKDVQNARIVVRLSATPKLVQVDLEDNGPGIPASLRKRIFEPFFSTKGDQGNGLGLWICSEVIHSHGGTVSVQEGATGGALFRILLPLDRTSGTPVPENSIPPAVRTPAAT